MMKNKVILKKDQNAIDNECYNLRDNLKKMTEFLNWHNELNYVTALKTIASIKGFFRTPNQYYTKEVNNYLLHQTGLNTLPPKLNSLYDQYNIEPCKVWSFDNTPYFDCLQLSDNLQLSYSKTVYEDIESRHTFYATEAEAAALAELDRMWINIEELCNIFSESEFYKRFYLDRFAQALGFITKPYALFGKDGGNQTRWDLEQLDKLAKAGFGKMLTKNYTNE
ncbi:MAG: hypothetical protein WC460_06905 [Patescibacteria group bacterium]